MIRIYRSTCRNAAKRPAEISAASMPGDISGPPERMSDVNKLLYLYSYFDDLNISRRRGTIGTRA